MSESTRVVITGMGAVTPIGLNVADYWDGLVAGKSASGALTGFDASAYKCKVAAEIKEWDGTEHFEKKEVGKMERFVQFSIVASREAFADAGFSEGDYDRDRFGVLIGSGVGGIQIVEDQTLLREARGPRRVTPFLIPRIICNEASGMASIDLNLRGPNMCIVTACAAGTHAIGEAMHIIKRGDADAMLCGGAESGISQLAIAGFGNMGALSKDTENFEKSSRPFDRTRNGFVMGEGAGVLVLESLEHAKKRGANIYAEVAGYGLNGDAFHITAPGPDGEGGARAIQMGLDRAGVAPEEVDHVNAHGTSTPLNDKLETMGIKTVFGDYAYQLVVTSNKSMIGHLIGAAGAVEAISSIKSINENIIPPTINYEEPDPECDLDYAPNVAKEREVKVVVSSSLGFGGHNCCVVLKLFEG